MLSLRSAEGELINLLSDDLMSYADKQNIRRKEWSSHTDTQKTRGGSEYSLSSSQIRFVSKLFYLREIEAVVLGEALVDPFVAVLVLCTALFATLSCFGFDDRNLSSRLSELVCTYPLSFVNLPRQLCHRRDEEYLVPSCWRTMMERWIRTGSERGKRLTSDTMTTKSDAEEHD